MFTFQSSTTVTANNTRLDVYYQSHHCKSPHKYDGKYHHNYRSLCHRWKACRQWRIPKGRGGIRCYLRPSCRREEEAGIHCHWLLTGLSVLRICLWHRVSHHADVTLLSFLSCRCKRPCRQQASDSRDPSNYKKHSFPFSTKLQVAIVATTEVLLYFNLQKFVTWPKFAYCLLWFLSKISPFWLVIHANTIKSITFLNIAVNLPICMTQSMVTAMSSTGMQLRAWGSRLKLAEDTVRFTPWNGCTLEDNHCVLRVV